MNKRVAKIRATYSEVDPDMEYRFEMNFDSIIKERTLVETMGVPIDFIIENQNILGKRKINNRDIFYNSTRALVLYWMYKSNGTGLEDKV